MKIDFYSSYRSIQKVIELPKAQPTPIRARANFAALVDQKPIAQPEKLLPKQPVTTPLEPANQNNQSQYVQRLSDKIPALKIPVLERAQVEVAARQPAEVAQTSVNKLTSTPQPSLGKTDYLKMIEQAGIRHGVDPMISMSVAAIESSFNPTAISSDGHYSKGLFQLLDSTGKDQMGRLGLERDYDPFNPDLNTDLGVGYLRYLLDTFSSRTQVSDNISSTPAANSSELEKLAVAAFNAGEGRVASAQQRAAKAGRDASSYQQVEAYLPESTQEYVQKVLRARGDFESYFLTQQTQSQS